MSQAQGPEILIASDHAGFDLKESLKKLFPEYRWRDLGPQDTARVDYPDYADRVANEVSAKRAERGVLICGSGQGMAIRANRYSGVRAALAWNEDTAKLAREHNDANVLCLGARFIQEELAQKILRLFLTTPFEGGRHKQRVDKLGRTVPTDNC